MSEFFRIAGFGFDNIKNKEKQKEAVIKHTLCKTQRAFKYTGLPESLPQREIEKYLQIYGAAVLFTDNEGLWRVEKPGFTDIPNGYYEPKKSIIVNPYFKVNKTIEDDVDGIILYNDSYRMGLTPILEKYAELIATNEITMYNQNILTRIQALLLAGDSNAKKEAQLYLKSIEKGDLAFLNSNSFTENITTSPYAQTASQSLTNLIEFEQYLKSSMWGEIGINSNYNMKRESLNSNEAQLNENHLLPFIDDMLYCRQQDMERFNKLAGFSITVEKDSVWEDIEEEEENDNGSLDSESDDGGASDSESESSDTANESSEEDK